MRIGGVIHVCMAGAEIGNRRNKKAPPSKGSWLRVAETEGVFAPKERKPPLCKGRWLAEGETEGLSVSLPDLFFLQNDSITIPHPLTREPPLHKGAFFIYASRQLPWLEGGFFICASRHLLVLGGVFLFAPIIPV